MNAPIVEPVSITATPEAATVAIAMPPEIDNTDWLRKKQVEEISNQFRTVWDMYLKFYTAFITFNIAAMGLCVQYISGNSIVPLVSVFIFQNLISLGTALRVATFSRESSARISLFFKEIANSHIDGTPHSPILTESPIPGDLAFWGGKANAISHILFVLAWIAVLVLKL